MISTNKEIEIVKTREWKYNKDEVNVILQHASKHSGINASKVKVRAARGPIIVIALRGPSCHKPVETTAHVTTANKKAFYMPEDAAECKHIIDFVFTKHKPIL